MLREMAIFRCLLLIEYLQKLLVSKVRVRDGVGEDQNVTNYHFRKIKALHDHWSWVVYNLLLILNVV